MHARSPELLRQLEDQFATEPDQGNTARFGFDVAEILETLRSGWRWPVYGCLIGLTLAAGFVFVASVPYKSTARILIDRSVNRYLQTNKIVDQPTFDEPEIASQVYVLSSDTVIVPVVRSLKLTEDREFVGNRSGAQVTSIFASPLSALRALIGWNSDNAVDPETILERIASEAVSRRLTVNREDVANVISVSFESGNPVKAARIANALADTYLSTTLEARLKSTTVISQWLQDRLADLKTQSMQADRALQEFRVANKVRMEGTSTQSNELLASLRTQLANARLATAEAKERLDLVNRTSSDGILTTVGVDALLHGSRSGTINFALNNTDLVRLRAQYRDAKARESDLEARLNPQHTVLIKLRQQIESLRSSINAEEQRIADVYINEFQVAKAREAELAASVERLAGLIGGGSPTQVKMSELENNAETLRNLYNTFLQRFSELHTTQAEALPVQNARIITRAVPPLSKSSKKPIAILAGGTVFGLLMGLGLVLGREWASNVFRTARAVERVSDKKCVVLPKVDPKSRLIEEFVLDAPYSRFTETLRNVKASIDTALLGHGGRVIGIVSAAPDEGKTTVTANLASLITISSGARTLVIDSDLHLHKLSETLAPKAKAGLLEALENPAQLPNVVVRRERSGLDVLPCNTDVRVPNAAELLGSPAMQDLLTAARKSYDYVLIEIAPIMSVVDLKIIERFIDAFVFVVEWGETKQGLVVDALSEAHMIRDRLVGMVLNKADPVALQNMEAFNGGKFRRYYQD